MLFLASFAAVMGPWTYVQHLASTPRLPFTAAYFGSIGLTLYFSLGVSHISVLSAAVDTDRFSASQYYPYLVFRHRAAGLPCLVPCELFPNGLERSTPCDDLRCSASSSMGEWLEKQLSRVQNSWRTPPRCMYQHLA